MALRIAPNLRIPVDAVTETFAILAKRGAGKTYMAAVLVEEMLKAKLQVVILDPMGAWWGLRSSADGKGAGFPIAILGGDRGDVPLEHTGGELIADLVVDEGVPAIVDLSLFSKGQRKTFVTDFAERLYHRNREPLHLVLEEADLVAPQRPMRGEERMLGAVEDLVRRGRGRGIGITLITQRSAVVNKDVLSQTENLIVLRTTSPHDRKAIEAWIDVHGEKDERDLVMDSLPSLPIGTAWFWSPGWMQALDKIKVRKRETFDSSATPKAGSRARTRPKTIAEVDLDALQTRMKATIEKAKAEDPKELRRQIAALKKELAQRPTETQVKQVVERVEVPVFKDSEIKRLEKVVGKVGDVGSELVAVAREVGSALQAAARPERPSPRRIPRDRAGTQKPTPPSRASSARGKPRDRAGIQKPEVPATDDEDVHLRKGERKMLEVLVRHHPMKMTRAQLATLSGFSVRGGTFGTYLGTLKRAGFIEESSGEVEVTQDGFDYLGAAAPSEPHTTEEVLDVWRNALRSGERAMLDELVAAYPNALTRDELAERTGFTVTGGTFGTYLGTLRRNGLVDVRGDEVSASETLFLSGVP